MCVLWWRMNFPDLECKEPVAIRSLPGVVGGHFWSSVLYICLSLSFQEKPLG